MKTLRTRTHVALPVLAALFSLLLYACDDAPAENSQPAEKPSKDASDTTGMRNNIETRLTEYNVEITRLSDSLEAYAKLGVLPLEKRAELMIPRNQEPLFLDKERQKFTREANIKWGFKYDSLLLLRETYLEEVMQLDAMDKRISHPKFEYESDSIKKVQYREILDFLKQTKPANSVTRKETVSSRTKTERLI